MLHSQFPILSYPLSPPYVQASPHPLLDRAALHRGKALGSQELIFGFVLQAVSVFLEFRIYLPQLPVTHVLYGLYAPLVSVQLGI